MASHTTYNIEPDGFSCLTCGVTCENEDTLVVAGPDYEVTAGDLARGCEGLSENEAHHFAPTVGGIACQWCALEVTPTTEGWSSACVREQ